MKFNKMGKILSFKDHDEIISIADSVFNKIICEFHIENPRLLCYLNRYENLFKSRFYYACINKNITSMVILEQEEENKGKMSFKME